MTVESYEELLARAAPFLAQPEPTPEELRARAAPFLVEVEGFEELRVRASDYLEPPALPEPAARESSPKVFTPPDLTEKEIPDYE